MAEASYHSSGRLTLDLTGAIRRLAGDGHCANLTEAVASLALGMLHWQPTSLHIDPGPTITGLGLNKPADLARSLAEHLLNPAPDPLPLRHHCLGLQWFLKQSGRAAWHTPQTRIDLGRVLRGARWPDEPPRPRDAAPSSRLRAQWSLQAGGELDLAGLRRRLLKCAVPIFVGGQPLLYLRTEPCTPEYLWETHDLHLPLAQPGLAAASLGTAGRDLGRELGQPARLRHGKTLILGRDFDGPAAPLYRIQKPAAESDSFFRSGPANWAAIPEASSSCALQLRARHSTRLFPVTSGFCLDPIELPEWEPGWRIWIPISAAPELSADLRRAPAGPLLGRARQALERARQRLAEMRPFFDKR